MGRQCSKVTEARLQYRSRPWWREGVAIGARARDAVDTLAPLEVPWVLVRRSGRLAAPKGGSYGVWEAPVHVDSSQSAGPWSVRDGSGAAETSGWRRLATPSDFGKLDRRSNTLKYTSLPSSCDQSTYFRHHVTSLSPLYHQDRARRVPPIPRFTKYGYSPSERSNRDQPPLGGLYRAADGARIAPSSP